jgi:Cu-Zn family superoxide dismutase
MKGSLLIGAACAVGFCASYAWASEQKVVDVRSVTAEGVGESIGTITFRDGKDGLEIVPSLKGLTPGEHGFHIHENPDCSPKEKDGKMTAAQAAGPHFDPHSTGKHLGPHGGGHEGDLPKLVADEHGVASSALHVEGLKVADVLNRSIMVHAGGDNYSDTPAPLGGGGARIACGVIK